MPDGEVRQVKISGAAVQDYTKERKPRGSTRRKSQQEGGDSPPGVSVTGGANYKAAALQMTKVIGGGPMSAATPPPVTIATPANAAAAAAATLPLMKAALTPMTSSAGPDFALRAQGGGADAPAHTKGKLVLTPAKSKATRKALLLTPPASLGLRLQPPGKRATKAPTGTKGTRKIRMQISGLKKRLTRSRDISKESRVKPVEAVRAELVAAKLIREKSTVPEAVMRDIWRDYQTLRGRAL